MLEQSLGPPSQFRTVTGDFSLLLWWCRRDVAKVSGVPWHHNLENVLVTLGDFHLERERAGKFRAS
jgi:hypothetical protein